MTLIVVMANIAGRTYGIQEAEMLQTSFSSWTGEIRSHRGVDEHLPRPVTCKLGQDIIQKHTNNILAAFTAPT